MLKGTTMKQIEGSVGEGGANTASDVALVQAILMKTQRAATPGQASGPYLDSYDGVCGHLTKAAIRAFQMDHVFVSANGLASAPHPLATNGLIKPNDASWEQLLLRVDPAFADMRVLAGGKTVYLTATTAQLQTKINEANGLTFAPEFAVKVRACINQMHALHGIAVGVCPQGDRRSFQAQYDLYTSGRNVTHAGPGESNHNFGMACDFGFAGLQWLRPNGEVVMNETPWLHQLTATSSAKANLFWAALRTVGTSAAVGAFRGPLSDLPHLQNWNDAGVVMADRLADLLTRSGSMRWSGSRGAYQCDFGLGGALYAVGTATQIWSRQAAVTLAHLAHARNAAASRSGPSTPAGPRLPAPTPADVLAMQNALRAQFELADANWPSWTPN
jgi:hypothetical protein